MGHPTLPIIAATILRKAAADEGFDIDLGEEGGWLRFESTHTPVAVALTASDSHWVLAVSLPTVTRELATEAVSWTGVIPPGTAMAYVAPDPRSLYHLLARARMLGRSLPTVPLARFMREAASLPRTTEAERIVVQRVGQDIFRDALLDYWNGRCPITRIDDPRLLRASHMKPWANCESDAERLDVHNGLLLAAHIDAAFDAGLITFDPAGRLLPSRQLSPENRNRLGLGADLHLALRAAHAPYLDWHRQEVFTP